jgi:dCMP deaminase
MFEKIKVIKMIKKLERDRQIVNLYDVEGMRTQDIADIFNLSQVRVQQILRKHHVILTHHIYKFDDTVLDVDSSIKFYLLGLFAADGTISKNRKSKIVEITLNENDRVLLNDIKNIFNTDKPLYLGKDGRLKFTLFSDKLHDIFVSYGIVERKSKTLEIKRRIPSEYALDFLRGVFDGDGNICGMDSADIILCLTWSKKFANQVIQLYKRVGFDVHLYNYGPKYIIKKCGQEGLKILANMYARRGLFLPRKYTKFLNFVRLTPDEMMMEIAHTCSKRSSCIRRKVGCVLTNSDKTNIVSIGYNGQARGEPNHCKSSLPGKCGCIHAEENALIKGSGLGSILFCTTIPCERCAKLIVNAGIKKVYYDADYRYSYALGLFNRSKIECKKLRSIDFQWKNEISRILEWKND